MGINDLQLSPELIAALYPETLVIARDPVPVVHPAEPEKTGTYSFLGKNQRSIAVLVSAPHHEFMPEEQIGFLKKILEACKCGMDDIAIINIYRGEADMESLKNQFKPRII